MSVLKSLLTNLTPSKVLKSLGCIYCSLCLVIYANNLYALKSIWLRLLVFGGILTVCGILLYIASRLFKSAPPSKAVLQSVAAAVLILFVCRNVFFPLQQKVYISLIAETAGEICLCDVVVDGKMIPVSQVEVVENSGWLYREQYDNFMIWPEEDGSENCLTLCFVAKEIHLGFPYTPYAGSVTITSSAGKGSGTWDLRCSEMEEVAYTNFPFDCRYVYSPSELLVYGTGLLPFLSLFCLILLYAAKLIGSSREELPLDLENKDVQRVPAFSSHLKFSRKLVYAANLVWKKVLLRGPSREELLLDPEHKDAQRFPAFSPYPKFSKKLVLQAALAIFCCCMLFSSIKIEPDKVTVIFLFLLTVGSCLCLSSDLAHHCLEKYMTRGKTALVMVIALYASFASFGQRFFLDGNTRIHISPEGVFYVALGMIWFIPVLYMLLFGLECLAAFPRKTRSKSVCRRAFWIMLVILCICQVVIVRSFWPGGYPADAISQLMQALGFWAINDWHPAINSILYRIILRIYPHVGVLIAIQAFFFALLCTHFLMLGYNHGVSFKALAILGVAFSLLPNLVIFEVSPLKDYPYTLSLLWGTYLLVRLHLNPGELRRWRFCAALALSMFLIYAFRHNGVMPFVAMLLAFAWITLRHFSRVKLRLAAVSLASVLMIAVYKGPVFSLFQVDTQYATLSPYLTMLCAVASCVNKDLPLSEKSTAIMESLLPLDQWADYYDRYLGYDTYYWGRGELSDEQPFEPTQITAKEAFTVYLEALCKYPDVVIKDRLDATDILWDVCQPSDSYTVKGFYIVNLEEVTVDLVSQYFDYGTMVPGTAYYNRSEFAKLYHGTLNTEVNSMFDMLLWRSGAYLILLMVLGVFWWTNRMKSLMLATVPLLGQIAGLTLVLYHQSYRYISAVQVLTLALAFCSVFLRSAEAGGWRQGQSAGKELAPSAETAQNPSVEVQDEHS